MIIGERVTALEETLIRFMEQSSLVVAAIREDVAEIRASNARTDRLLLKMQQQADHDRQQAEKVRQQDREQAEKTRQQDREQAEKVRQQDREQAEKDRQQAEKHREQAERERKDFNKRLAELSESMGTLIEDMVSPGGFRLASAIFGGEEASECAIRVRRKHPTIKGEMMELDMYAVSATKIVVFEVKRRLDAAKVVELRQKLRRVPEFFPEFAGKTICPAVATVYIDSSVIAFLDRERIYGIAMGDDVMEVVNLGHF